MVTHSYDVLVIGSGAAGLGLSLHLAPDARVAVLSKGPLYAGSTYYAQGGISAVLDESHDSIASHIQDTLVAGAGLCNEEAVRYTVEHGREAVDWLIQLGVAFTRQEGESGALHLTREGGHSHRRVVHSADATGRAIESKLIEATCEHDNIELFDHHLAVDLISSFKLTGKAPNQCLGAYVLDLETGKVEEFRARFVILATGGAGKAYLYTSNPDGTTGDGIAMGWRAGCRIANMEFMQFHPTCLYHPKAKSFLISEAVRGEGGKLLLSDGTRFMDQFDPRGELAPRDIVARAIDHEMKRLGEDCVYLDISDKSAEFIEAHFPTIYARCLKLGIDITRDPIPVVPAAHYTCGGVMTDLRARTDVDRLYAIGEVAHTGLHGANRMASNSLLECLVFAKAAAEDITARLDSSDLDIHIPPWDERLVTDSDEEVVVSHNWEELRRFMWDYVGIVRTDKRLQRALNRIQLLQREIDEYYSNFRVSNDLIELRNLAQAAELIILSAMQRKESRGLHYTLDYPELRPELDHVDTILESPLFLGEDFNHRVPADG